MIEEDEERTAVKKQRVKGKKESKGSELKKKRSLNIPDLRLGRPKPSEASPMPVMEEEPRASVQMQKDFDDLIVQPAPEVEERSIEPIRIRIHHRNQWRFFRRFGLKKEIISFHQYLY